jgi:exodeoxyribonuclease VII large subunit
VTDTESAKAARALELQFADGRLALGPKRRAKPDEPPDQGSLF